MKRFRQPKTLVEDGLVEERGSFITVASGNITEMRSPLVVNVLCKLPEEEYQIVKGRQVWFLSPASVVSGWNGQIPPGKSQLIYLAPHLESYSRKGGILTVAHEIVHALLGHAGSNSGLEMEDETWAKVAQLEFGTDQDIRELRLRRGTDGMR